MNPLKRSIEAFQARRHYALLIALLILFVVTPIVVRMRFGVVAINMIAASVLLLAVNATVESRRQFHLEVWLTILSIACTSMVLVFKTDAFIIASHACFAVLTTLFSISILGYVLRRGRITADKILAAACVYLLMGYAFTFGYALLEDIQPGSFSGFQTIKGVNPFVWRVIELRYFSFVTLTTVGYGDVLPLTPAARTFANLEAIIGQFYLTVLVARLVGLHIAHADDSRS